jgi:hypothetical protein
VQTPLRREPFLESIEVCECLAKRCIIFLLGFRAATLLSGAVDGLQDSAIHRFDERPQFIGQQMNDSRSVKISPFLLKIIRELLMIILDNRLRLDVDDQRHCRATLVIQVCFSIGFADVVHLKSLIDFAWIKRERLSRSPSGKCRSALVLRLMAESKPSSWRTLTARCATGKRASKAWDREWLQLDDHPVRNRPSA